MGVQNLWDLLAPVGRRVSVETLSGKKLAIDASIWMVQFMKAMRDEKGEMVRNAHLIGFFRRICKLLFLRTKPVFVFDGGTPALKRRTVIARRRQRENAQAKIRKTAEKLLLNHLKTMRVKELVENLENQRKENDLKGKSVVVENIEEELAKDVEKKRDLKGKGVLVEEVQVLDNSLKSSDSATRLEQEAFDAMLAASLAEEEYGSVVGKASSSVLDGVVSQEEDDEDGDEEMVLPLIDGKVDPAVLAALPPSMQLDLLVQMRERLMAENRQKYQKIKKAPAKFSELQIQSYLKTVAFRREINEVQKSAAGKGAGGVETSRIASEANREYIFSSSFTGDKQTLTSAGIGKGGDVGLLTKGKEAASTNSVNQVSSVTRPSFGIESGVNGPLSDLNDVETYVDERGRLRVSRVRAMGIRMTRDLQRNLDLMKEIQHEKDDNPSEQREAIFNKIVLGDPGTFSVNNPQLETSSEGNHVKSSFNGDEMQREYPQVPENRTAMNISFFEDEIISGSTDDDDIFAHLVAGSSVALSPAKDTFPGKQPSDTQSDCSWDEGTVYEKGVDFSNDIDKNSRMSLEKENIIDENEVDWEEVVCDVMGDGLASVAACNKAISTGSLEEEADIDEVIRSLEDSPREKSVLTSYEKKEFEVSREKVRQNAVIPDFLTGKEVDSVNLPVNNDTLPSQISYEAVPRLEKLDHVVLSNIPLLTKSTERHFESSGESETRNKEQATLIHTSCDENLVPKITLLNEVVSGGCIVHEETPCRDPVSHVEPESVDLISDQVLDTEGGEGLGFVGSNSSSKITSLVSAATQVGSAELNLVDDHQNDFEAMTTCHLYKETDTANSLEESSANELASSAYVKRNVVDEDIFCVNDGEIRRAKDNSPIQSIVEVPVGIPEASLDEEMLHRKKEPIDLDDKQRKLEYDAESVSTIQNNIEVPIELTEASLDEEMLHLRQERIDLGDEQRKLERNAESVNSEMFAECQELLQMFGLPYIIAPMEAEAQCAYLELAKLVDGVVTDDSDVFLFGARNVYKNIFDDRKYVEMYFMKDIEEELGLTREQLVRMALLLGSDYTEGVSGIGIVNAIEVVHAFPEEDGLQKFREWLESPDPTILGKLDTQTGPGSRKRGSHASKTDTDITKGAAEGSSSDKNVSEGQNNGSKGVNGGPVAGGDASEGHASEQSVDVIQKTRQIFMDNHRNVSKNWHIPLSFPSEAVVSAYISPQVDTSTESFSWGKPDLFVLRKLCWEKFGWSNERADDLLLPVLKEYNKHETQLRLEAFYTFNEKFAKIRSKRINKAVKGITGKRSSELMDDLPKKVSRRKMSPPEPDKIVENCSLEEDSAARNKCSISIKSTAKQSRKSKIKTIPLSNEDGEPSIEKEDNHSVKKGTSENVGGRGRGRGRGRGSGRGEEVLAYESAETVSSDRSSSDNEPQSQVQMIKNVYGTRKSTRHRKHIRYNEDDLKSPSKALDQSDKDGAVEQEPVCDHTEKDGETFFKDGCHSEYLEMGGGFCLGEDKRENDTHPLDPTSARLSNRERIHHSVEDGFPDDYHAMGSGFCVAECDLDNELVQPDNGPVEPLSSSTRDLDEVTAGRIDAPITLQNLDSPSWIGDHDSTNLGVLNVNRLEKPDSSTGTTGLTAMPFLRRKRRKR